MKTVDVEQIMQDIRNDIRLRQLDADILPFEDVEMPEEAEMPMYTKFSIQKLDEIVSMMNSRYIVSTDMLLIRSGGIRGRIVSVVKRAVRKCIIPVVDEQNMFNIAVTKGMNMLQCMAQEVMKNRSRIVALEKQVDACEDQIAHLQEQIRQMKEDRDK